jgi:hypothetical protein
MLLNPVSNDIEDTLDPNNCLCAVYNLDHILLQLFIVSFDVIG